MKPNEPEMGGWQLVFWLAVGLALIAAWVLVPYLDGFRAP